MDSLAGKPLLVCSSARLRDAAARTAVERLWAELRAGRLADLTAALFLALSVFADGGEVILSRGERVGIGGSIRVPWNEDEVQTVVRSLSEWRK